MRLPERKTRTEENNSLVKCRFLVLTRSWAEKFISELSVLLYKEA